jgi:phosphoribosylamine--glycine ligase
MNVLVVSNDLSAGDLCVRLSEEGHDIRVYIADRRQAVDMEGMIVKVRSWKRELRWVGKDGLILFDGTGWGRTQDLLRGKGYSVVGGSELGDRSEEDRAYGQTILWASGVRIVTSVDFNSLDEAISFVQKHPRKWVIKQNGNASKIFNYVGNMSDGSDVINVLGHYREHQKRKHIVDIELQERIHGVEIAVGRYFNGKDWVGPICMNVEHKDLCDGDLGPKTFEMGTLAWFDDDEENPLFLETLAKVADFLRSAKFHGDVDINCIVNERGVFPLEFTARFGYPILQLQMALSSSPWGSFLKAIADGESFDFNYPKGKYGVVILVAVPPFPYSIPDRKIERQDLDIFFREPLTEDERNRIHFQEVSRKSDGTYFVSGEGGQVLHVSGIGDTIEAARKSAYELIGKIIIPKMFYRTDIGTRFIETDLPKLRRWGWVK